MKLSIFNTYNLVAPLMIVVSIIGFNYSNERKKYFYLPMGFVGSYLIIIREIGRKRARKEILNKVQLFRKVK